MLRSQDCLCTQVIVSSICTLEIVICQWITLERNYKQAKGGASSKGWTSKHLPWGSFCESAHCDRQYQVEWIKFRYHQSCLWHRNKSLISWDIHCIGEHLHRQLSCNMYWTTKKAFENMKSIMWATSLQMLIMVSVACCMNRGKIHTGCTLSIWFYSKTSHIIISIQA